MTKTMEKAKKATKLWSQKYKKKTDEIGNKV